MQEKTKLIVIIGPTASGKSDIAVSLAKKFTGEVISADSRQVYKGLNIGTQKVLQEASQESSFQRSQKINVNCETLDIHKTNIRQIGEFLLDLDYRA